MGIYEMDTKKFNSKNLIYYYYENLIKPKKLETRNTLIDKKSYKALVINFTWYNPDKS